MKHAILSIIIAFFWGLSFSVPRAEAALITIAIEAEVTGVEDPHSVFDGKIKPGDTIVGTYTYDLLTPDSEPLAYAGLYQHHNPPAGISLNISGFNFRTDPDNVDFVVAILNNYPPSLKDQFWMRSYNNLPLSNGTPVDHISWQLDDPTGTAISGTALPTGPLMLDDWQSIYGLRLDGVKDTFHVTAEVTSAVPEPGTILLFGLVGLLLRKRS